MTFKHLSAIMYLQAKRAPRIGGGREACEFKRRLSDPLKNPKRQKSTVVNSPRTYRIQRAYAYKQNRPCNHVAQGGQVAILLLAMARISINHAAVGKVLKRVKNSVKSGECTDSIRLRSKQNSE